MPTYQSFADEIRRLDRAIEALAPCAAAVGVAPPAGQEWFELLRRKLIAQLDLPPLLVVAIVGGTQGPLPVDGITRASLTGADGKIYVTSESGKVVVFAAGDEYKVLAVNTLGEAPCRSSVAISDGQLFIRTAKSLYCIGKQK